MGVLADIYSGGNTLKRRLNALIKDPAETLGLGVTRFGEDQNQLINLLRNAYPMAGEKTVLNSPQQMAQFRGELADKGAEQAMAAATVWHGSPHKFDKFDSSKIGTGEGAQAYGHGLYLAESDKVAKQYADNVKDMGAIKNINTRLSALAKEMDNYKGAEYGKFSSPKGYELKAEYDALMASRSGVSQASGNMYKVDLPDEHIAKMLDYDNPIPEAVRKPLSKAALDQFGSGLTDASGEKLYKEMIFNFKQAGHSNPTQAATDWLTQQGVPGMRYLDGGSRGAGSGSSNFVIFPGNENLLSIMERNGQPVLNKLLGK